jgi:hypothetical protein
MVPFGCEAVVPTKSGLYLTRVVSKFRDRYATYRGQVGSPYRTLPQVYHRLEERIL